MADAVGGYSAAVGYFALFEAEGFAVGDELVDEFAVEAGWWSLVSAFVPECESRDECRHVGRPTEDVNRSAAPSIEFRPIHLAPVPKSAFGVEQTVTTMTHRLHSALCCVSQFFGRRAL